MSLGSLPEEFGEFATAAVDAILRAYEINASRYEPEAGDDAVVFGICIYRNSWYLVEQEVAELDHWRSSRPSGSLVIVGAGLRLHVYRHGQDASVDLDGFRLDEEASTTKRLIATSNAAQMTLALEWPEGSDEAADASGLLSDPGLIETLRDLVIVHAGNPDDGCCGIWAGAPVATEDETASPWAWIEPLWLPDTGIQGVDETAPSPPAPVPHHELPEPEIVLTAVQDDEAGQGES